MTTRGALLALALAAGCSITKHHHTEAVLLGRSSRVVTRCDETTVCERDPTAKHDDEICRTTSHRCSVEEIGASRKTPLVPRTDAALTPLAMDHARHIAWFAWAGRIVGVATVASDAAGARLPPPPEMAGTMENGEAPRPALGGLVIARRLELTGTFRFWEVATGHVVEVVVPILPSPGAYDLDAYLTTCVEESDGQVLATRVDLAATLAKGEAVVVQARRPWTAAEHAASDRYVACRAAMRAAPTGG